MVDTSCNLFLAVLHYLQRVWAPAHAALRLFDGRAVKARVARHAAAARHQAGRAALVADLWAKLPQLGVVLVAPAVRAGGVDSAPLVMASIPTTSIATAWFLDASNDVALQLLRGPVIGRHLPSLDCTQNP